MKSLISISLFLIGLTCVMGQNTATIATMDIKRMDGTTISTDSITNNGKPIIISFWATWCKPCVKELTTISEVYEEWVEETGVKLFAISIDDQKTFNSVATFVNGRDWPFPVFCDPNHDFKRAMSVNQVPHTFILDKDRNIVWHHESFSEGGELQLIELIRKLINGETISE